MKKASAILGVGGANDRADKRLRQLGTRVPGGTVPDRDDRDQPRSGANQLFGKHDRSTNPWSLPGARSRNARPLDSCRSHACRGTRTRRFCCRTGSIEASRSGTGAPSTSGPGPVFARASGPRRSSSTSSSPTQFTISPLSQRLLLVPAGDLCRIEPEGRRVRDAFVREASPDAPWKAPILWDHSTQVQVTMETEPDVFGTPKPGRVSYAGHLRAKSSRLLVVNRLRTNTVRVSACYASEPAPWLGLDSGNAHLAGPGIRARTLRVVELHAGNPHITQQPARRRWTMRDSHSTPYGPCWCPIRAASTCKRSCRSICWHARQGTESLGADARLLDPRSHRPGRGPRASNRWADRRGLAETNRLRANRFGSSAPRGRVELYAAPGTGDSLQRRTFLRVALRGMPVSVVDRFAAGRGRCYVLIDPPSTAIVWPVTKSLSGGGEEQDRTDQVAGPAVSASRRGWPAPSPPPCPDGAGSPVCCR